MTIPLLLSIKDGCKFHGIAMERFYEYFGISRQGFDKASRKLNEELEMMNIITKSVHQYRLKFDRRAGSRSLFYNMNIKDIYGIGVTKFEQLMSKYGLTLLPIRTRVITTQSSLQSWNYPNLCNGLIVNQINQIVVGDLTYIAIGKNRYYMFCLIDVFSARIVGFCISERMRSKEAMSALFMWIKLRGKDNLFNCIHHTDGGTQYFAAKYLEHMTNTNLQISVARNCLQNGYAEQKNGLLKHHLIPTINSSSTSGIVKAVQEIIYFYNYHRKQQPLGWKSPVEFEKDHEKHPCRQLILHDHDGKAVQTRKVF